MKTASVDLERMFTVEEYLQLPDLGYPTELVRGRVVKMTVPTPRHGEICANLAIEIGPYVKGKKLGRLVCNDGGVLTEREPDCVRGPDVAFWSNERVPPGPLPRGYLEVVPELIFEVRSPTDRWTKLVAKAMEYLEAGVTVVCIVDEVKESVTIYRDAEELPQKLHNHDELHLPDILGDFRVSVHRFFE